MATYDWIVIGNGVVGAALSYELQKVGLSVLVLDSGTSEATRYSYGGIAYWLGTTDLMRQLCEEGIIRHRQLAAELDADTQFREIDLLLTIASNRDPEQVLAAYANVLVSPTLLSSKQAGEVEPLLNPAAISAALQFPYAHVSPEATVAAYNQAFSRLGGKIQIATVIELVWQGQQVRGVVTPNETYMSANVVVCAGAMTQRLLQSVNLPTRIYFTHTEIIETVPVALKLQSLVMPAELQRFEMEAKAAAAEIEPLWNQPGHEVAPAILDVGAVQFRDGRLRMGQLSRVLTDPNAMVDQASSEATLRHAVGQVLPALEQLPGQWCRCRVAFCADRLPLIGALPNAAGLYVFSGFSNPFAILPPLARRFAQVVIGKADALLAQLSPSRFSH